MNSTPMKPDYPSGNLKRLYVWQDKRQRRKIASEAPASVFEFTSMNAAYEYGRKMRLHEPMLVWQAFYVERGAHGMRKVRRGETEDGICFEYNLIRFSLRRFPVDLFGQFGSIMVAQQPLLAGMKPDTTAPARLSSGPIDLNVYMDIARCGINSI